VPILVLNVGDGNGTSTSRFSNVRIKQLKNKLLKGRIVMQIKTIQSSALKISFKKWFSLFLYISLTLMSRIHSFKKTCQNMTTSETTVLFSQRFQVLLSFDFTVKNNPVKKKTGKLLAAVVASIIP